MQEKHLHIICHDVPFPADYGGVFDPFYKIKFLHQAGVKIHLHCFEYGRDEQPALQAFCEEVHYYPRRQGHKGFSHKIPYIVCSRANKELLDILLRDDFPILAEGVHCSFLLNDERFAGRKIVLRLHNVEWLYYRQLFKSSSSLFKKIYYFHESKILKQYERDVISKAFLVAVSEQDAAFYKEEFSATHVQYLPVFLPFDDVTSQKGTGCYCLYHGNLSVEENEKAVIWLLEEVFKDLPLPLVIAGKQPSNRLTKIACQYPNACLVADPSGQEIQDIIEKAQLHILPSFNCTGIKLKMLHALYSGRHCVVNEEAVRKTGLDEICHVAGSALSFKDTIANIYHCPFGEDEIEKRKTVLLNKFNNERNAEQLIQWIW
ncbi:MAG: mannosyltransferase [Bacteroidetes bacterium]|nr:MAG: mannosyltransferase [Bacteroidota bacterium]